MTPTRRQLLFAVAGLLAAGGGIATYLGLRRLRGTESAAEAQSPVDRLFNLRLPDPSGAPQAVSKWRGRWLLVNFWATWCEPCREEIPLLVQAQSRMDAKNLLIIGISIDNADKVSQFSSKFSINYPLLVGGLESIDLARAFGNRTGGLPYTLLISPKGQVVAAHLGGMSTKDLDAMLRLAAR